MSRQYTLQRAPRSTSIHIDYAAELNEQQLAAVTAPPGPLLVIAGAGSGKTRTLTYRVAYLLENGIDPRNILLLTFTNKAAREMLDRVANFLPLLERIKDVHDRYEKKKKATNSMDFDDLLQKTLSMFQQHERIAEFYRRQFQFILVDEYQDTTNIQADLVDMLALDHKNVMVVGDDAQSIYSWRGANFQNILEFPRRYPDAQVFKIEMNYRSVPEILDVANAAIAANVEQFRKNLQPTRESKAMKPALVALNDGAEQAQFVAQRILELRDENVDLNEIAVLYRAHYHAIELQLELSRRGIPYQITSGIRFFEQAHIKDVTAFIRFVANPRDEVAFKRMVKLLPGIGNRSAENLWNVWDRSLTTVAGGGDPGSEATSTPAGVTAPGYNFGERLLSMNVSARSKKAWEQLAHTLDEIAPGGQPNPPSEMITSIVEAIYDDYAKVNFANYELRREDLNQLAAFSRQFKDVHEFLAQLALISNVDAEAAPNQGADKEAVNLSTVHQAKGLEFHAIFVIWLSDGMFPSSRSLDTRDALEEERRLFYVAITRARDELYLTYPHMRLSGGYGDVFQRPSRFLQEIPNELVEDWQVRRG